MLYLKSFTLVSRDDEDSFVLSYPYQLEMQCYSHTNVYPFKLFPEKGLHNIEFAPITVFYGSNGSGKSTLLNVIAEKLSIASDAQANTTPYMAEYVKRCRYALSERIRALPPDSRKIASDDVFDYLLDVRALNAGVDKRRDELFDEYTRLRETPMTKMRSLDDYEALREQNEAKHKTKSAYVTRRLSREIDGRSNGENAFAYFTHKIRENALYLLDEPENSLSAERQLELVEFIESSVRFYGCQFVISTHSPFLLAMKNTRIYDLDSRPVLPKRFGELRNMQVFYRFFTEHRDDFEG